MIRHVAVFRWRPDTSVDQIEALRTGLAALPDTIPEIRSYRFGPDATLVPNNADFAVVADFDDEQDWRSYMDHPAHDELRRQLLAPIIGERMAVQLVLPG